MKFDDCYKVGFILKPHGLKGEVTISLDREFPANGSELKTLFIEKRNQLVPYFIERIGIQGNKALVKFDEVDDSEAAQAVSRLPVYLPKQARPKSAQDSFYDDEIVGFEVSDSAAGFLGKVAGVTTAGPNKLLSIDHEGKEVLIPVNGPFIRTIDKLKKKIDVALPDGFLEI